MQIKSSLNIKLVVLLLSLILTALLISNFTCEAEVTVELEAGSVYGTIISGDSSETYVDPITKQVTVGTLESVTITLYVDTAGKDDPGTTIATAEDGTPLTATTGADGTFEIINVPSGWYDILIEDPSGAKSSLWIQDVFIWIGADYNLSAITLMPRIGSTEFRVTLSWTGSDDLDFHLTHPTVDDPCASVTGNYFAGTCTGGLNGVPVQEIWYEYPWGTDAMRNHIYPDAADYDFDLGLDGTVTGIQYRGDVTSNPGPEILDFNTADMPFGQYLITVVNGDEANLDSSAYGLGESGAVVRLYGPDKQETVGGETKYFSNLLLTNQVGKDMSGNFWRVLFVDYVYDADNADPNCSYCEIWGHPFNMYHYVPDGAYEAAYFNVEHTDGWFKLFQ